MDAETFDYRTWLQRIKLRYDQGKIQKIEAKHLIRSVEWMAYEADPEAEPDGDITHACATLDESL